MAVVLTLTVSPATHDLFEALDERVEQAILAAGGPPAGLMSHVVYPDADGFVVSGVWRTEDEARVYLEETLRPVVTGVGLTPRETRIYPVWSFARPWKA